MTLLLQACSSAPETSKLHDESLDRALYRYKDGNLFGNLYSSNRCQALQKVQICSLLIFLQSVCSNLWLTKTHVSSVNWYLKKMRTLNFFFCPEVIQSFSFFIFENVQNCQHFWRKNANIYKLKNIDFGAKIQIPIC